MTIDIMLTPPPPLLADFYEGKISVIPENTDYCDITQIALSLFFFRGKFQGAMLFSMIF